MKLTVIMKPNTKKPFIETHDDGSLVVHTKSAPVDGKANEELIRLLSKYFHVTQASIVIKHGMTNKKKTIEILQK